MGAGPGGPAGVTTVKGECEGGDLRHFSCALHKNRTDTHTRHSVPTYPFTFGREG